MKKVISAFLVIALLLAVSSSSFAQPNKTYANGQDVKPATGYLTGVKYNNTEQGEYLDIYLIDYYDYSIMSLTEPDRIVVDVFNAAAPGKQQVINAGGRYVKTVRYAQFDINTARIVLDLNSDVSYGVDKTEFGLRVYVGELPPEKDGTGASGGTEDKPGPDSPKGGGDETGGKETGDSGKEDTVKSMSIHKNFNVRYTRSESIEEVAILLSEYKGYTVFRLTGPDRLVLDIPNSQYTGELNKIEANGTQVKAVRYAQYTPKLSRVVLDLNKQSQYTITEKKGMLVIKVEEPSYKNMVYYNNGDRVYLNLDGAVLTKGDEKLEQLYTAAYSNSGKTYTITFPSGQADLGAGTLKINDDYLKSVEIKNNAKNGTTSIVINAVAKFSYVVFTRNDSNDTNITIVRPASKGEKLVVIDPGHGGRMPGAIYKDMSEKDLNLDIAKRLNTLLQEKKVKTYLIRNDDSHVANYERAYIANALNASLFLSVHNNASDSSSVDGTMTLYFPPKKGAKGFTGKTFAEIVQARLLAALGTADRKIRERPNLVVLKATKMPAAIAEVAYLTNSSDRNNLKKATFRQKAAEALCESVLKVLQQIK